MREPKPVKIWRQIVIGFIPFGWLFALSNIAKLRMGLAIFLPLNFGVGFTLGLFFEWLGFPPYSGMAVGIAVHVTVWIYLIKKWSLDWNKQFPSPT